MVRYQEGIVEEVSDEEIDQCATKAVKGKSKVKEPILVTKIFMQAS